MKKRTARAKKSNGISAMHKPEPVPIKAQAEEKQAPEVAKAPAAAAASKPKVVGKSRALRSVQGDLTFKLRDGKELSNLIDLASALEEMADETFSHHANGERNDFSNWVKDVFGLDDLAEQIRILPRTQMGAKMYKHLLKELIGQS